MAIRIVLPRCEGPQTTAGARIFDDETGEEITGVYAINLEMDPDAWVFASVKLAVMSIEYADE